MPSAPYRPARPPRTFGVLVVDDDSLMRTLVSRTLTTAGYTVWTAANATEARRLLPTLDRQVDAVLTDVAMPGGLGTEVADDVQSFSPYTRLGYMSSYSPDRLKEKGVDLKRGVFLSKPFMPGELVAFVEGLVRPR